VLYLDFFDPPLSVERSRNVATALLAVSEFLGFMGKKKGGGDGGPGAKAKEQKAASAAKKKAEEEKKKEQQKAQEWDKGGNERAERRREQEEAKEAAKMALAAAKKEQEAKDAAELAKMRAPAGKQRKAERKKGGKPKKNDMSALDAFLAQEEAEKKKKAKKKALASATLNTNVEADDLLKPNLNRELLAQKANGEVVASGIDGALEALNANDGAAEKAPNRKALYMAFEEREMARLRDENPGLKRSQLKDKVWKLWQKSPENPDNQES